jgi:ubiquinone/menaquinone biosynthesis C-methylase UbiE
LKPVNVLAYYDHHPIDERYVLAAAARRRGTPGAPLRAEDLFDFDQDHYGGVAAVDVLATRAGLRPGALVADLCAGLAGPARFLAARRRCRVVAVELHGGRAAGAARLTRLVALDRVVRVVRGDAAALPLASGRFDACLAQEGFLHVEDKAAVLAEARRILAPGGRLAFTDWVATARLSDLERARLREWTAATGLPTVDGYRALLGRVGFGAVEAEDLADEWRPVLRARLDAHRAQRGDLVARLGEAWYAEYGAIYAFFVGLVEAGRLSGARFTGTA